jgi:cell division protein FtsA
MNHTENQKLLGAIDIGTTKIVSVIGRKNPEGRFEILGMGTCPSYGVKRGLVMNIEETVSSIRTAVSKMAEGTSLSTENVVVGIAGQHVKSIKNTMKIPIRAKDGIIHEQDMLYLKNRMFETQVGAGESILHVIPQHYRIDGKDTVENPVGWFAKELEGTFHLVVGKLSSMENLKNCVRRVDKSVEKLILEPLASADAVLSMREKEMGVALVDIGGGTTDVAVYQNKTLQHTAVIPFGGNVVTSDIKQAFHVLESQAEELKIQYGAAIQSKTQKDVTIQVPGIKGREAKDISLNDLVYVIQERMKEIVYAIKFQIEESGYADNLGAGIVLTGGGALLKNLSQLIKAITGFDVIVGYPREHIFGPFADEVNEPMFSTAVGLLIQYDQMLAQQAHEADIPDLLYEEEEEPETDEEDEPESPKQKPKRGKFFEKIKNTIVKSLEEDDNFDNE